VQAPRRMGLIVISCNNRKHFNSPFVTHNALQVFISGNPIRQKE